MTRCSNVLTLRRVMHCDMFRGRIESYETRKPAIQALVQVINKLLKGLHPNQLLFSGIMYIRR
jgi:hypothetical protein